MFGVELLAGEVVRSVETGLRIALLNGPPVHGPTPYAPCECAVTNARLILSLTSGDVASSSSMGRSPFRGPVVLPLAGLDTINMEQQPSKGKEVMVGLELQNRDCQVVSILFSQQAAGRAMLAQLCNHKLFTFQFAMDHCEARIALGTHTRGEVPFGAYSPRRGTLAAVDLRGGTTGTSLLTRLPWQTLRACQYRMRIYASTTRSTVWPVARVHCLRG